MCAGLVILAFGSLTAVYASTNDSRNRGVNAVITTSSMGGANCHIDSSGTTATCNVSHLAITVTKSGSSTTMVKGSETLSISIKNTGGQTFTPHIKSSSSNPHVATVSNVKASDLNPGNSAVYAFVVTAAGTGSTQVTVTISPSNDE